MSAPSLFNKDGPMGEELGLVRRTFNLRSLIDVRINTLKNHIYLIN